MSSKFDRIADLSLNRENPICNLIVGVVATNQPVVVGGGQPVPSQYYEVTVGDNSGCVVLRMRGDRLSELGCDSQVCPRVLLIKNGLLIHHNGRLKVELTNSATIDVQPVHLSLPDRLANISQIQYELVK